MSTTITVEGNLTGDPVLRTVPAEAGQTATVANLRIAVSDRWRDDAGRWLVTDPVFYDVAVWGGSAGHIGESLRSGDRVVVHGELRQRRWAGDDGESRQSATITASMVGLSLRYVSPQLSRRPAALSGSRGPQPAADLRGGPGHG